MDVDREGGSIGDEPGGGHPGTGAAPTEERFGPKDWLLVALVFVAFLIVPWAIIAAPPSGLPFYVAYLAIPFLMAVVLAVVAVWTAVS